MVQKSKNQLHGVYPIPLASLHPTAPLRQIAALAKKVPAGSDIHGIHGLLLGLFVKGTTVDGSEIRLTSWYCI